MLEHIFPAKSRGEKLASDIKSKHLAKFTVVSHSCVLIVHKYHNEISPSCRVVELWREDLAKTNAKAAQSLADPTEYENLFPELKQALQAEEFLKRERSSLLPAATFTSVPVSQSHPLSLSPFSRDSFLFFSFCVCRFPVNVMSLKSLRTESPPCPPHQLSLNETRK